jgi:hypothetical protein
MKQYLHHIGKGLVIALVGATVVGAAWSEPSTSPSAGNRDIPVNSSSFHQIKPQGLGVQTFFAAGNAQFDQAVFASGMIRGGTPAMNPMQPTTVYFGDTTNKVGIDANGTLYVTDTITTPVLSNIGQQQVCADQYGTLVICQ